MIAQPMDARGFSTLASRFPDRTVVTYDPRDRVAVPGQGLRLQRAVLAGSKRGELFMDTLKGKRPGPSRWCVNWSRSFTPGARTNRPATGCSRHRGVVH